MNDWEWLGGGTMEAKRRPEETAKIRNKSISLNFPQP